MSRRARPYRRASTGRSINFNSRAQLMNRNMTLLQFFVINFWFAVSVRNGYSCVPIALSEGLDIRLSTAVREINYGPNGVEITTSNAKKEGSCTVLEADVALCTLPLGVLKYSVQEHPPNPLHAVKFVPPLPQWKISAIDGLGFGNLNKVGYFIFDGSN